MQNEPIYILLADDDPDDRSFFTQAFKEIKVNTVVQTVNDGRELMNLLTKAGAILPHVLFLDLNMPFKNGIECLKEIKQIERLKNVAIAIYSTSASENDIEETFVRGANVYINKPDSFSNLKKILEEVIIINWQYETSGLNRETFLLNL